MPLNLEPPREDRSRNYRVRGTYLGVRVDRSTETPDKRTAKKFLKRLKEAIEAGHLAKPDTLKVWQAIDSYAKAGFEDKFLAKIKAHFGPDAVAEDITQADIDAGAAILYPDAAPATRNRQFYTPLLAALHHAGIDKRFRRPQGACGSPRQVYLTPEQFEAVHEAARAINADFAKLLLLLVYTGLRQQEALALPWSGVELAHGVAHVAKTKNGDPRIVALPPRVLVALEKMQGREGRVFPWKKGGNIYSLAERAYRAAGVDDGGAPFHVLRHTYGAWMTRAGADLVATGAWKSPKAARVYQHFGVNEESRKADLLPGAKVA